MLKYYELIWDIMLLRNFLKKVLTNTLRDGIMCLWLAMANSLRQFETPEFIKLNAFIF